VPVDARIIVAEWRAENASLRFPFTDRSTLQSSTGITLPENAFVDAAVHPPEHSGRVFLGEIRVTLDATTYVLSSERASELATGVRTDDVIWFYDSLGRSAGVLVVDPDVLPTNWPLGNHAFRQSAEFVPSVIEPSVETGPTSLVLPDGSLISGDVWLVGDAGVVLTVQDNVLDINVVGDPLFRRRLCDPEVSDVYVASSSLVAPFFTPTYLQYISIPVNGEWVDVPADEFGGFVIMANDAATPDSVLRVYPRDGTIRIELVGKLTIGV
jgi:hypothetical protein